MSLQQLQDVGLLFRTVNFNFREQVDRALREGGVGLSFGQVTALSILDLRPGINGAELARHAMVSAQAMTGVLRTLAARRLLERHVHPGSLRADSWHVSPAGKRLLGRARIIFGAVMARMLAPLSVAEQREFERCLRLCAESLEGAAGGGEKASAARRATRAGRPPVPARSRSSR
jgi:DNA-binding MarR family transcriptional regulator